MGFLTVRDFTPCCQCLRILSHTKISSPFTRAFVVATERDLEGLTCDNNTRCLAGLVTWGRKGLKSFRLPLQCCEGDARRVDQPDLVSASPLISVKYDGPVWLRGCSRVNWIEIILWKFETQWLELDLSVRLLFLGLNLPACQSVRPPCKGGQDIKEQDQQSKALPQPNDVSDVTGPSTNWKGLRERQELSNSVLFLLCCIFEKGATQTSLNFSTVVNVSFTCKGGLKPSGEGWDLQDFQGHKSLSA